VSPFDRYASAVVAGQVPYRDVSIEYPPGALPPIVAPATLRGISYTSAFRAFETLLGCALVVCVAYLLREARRQDLVVGVALVAAMPLLLGQVVFFRFDLWPALLVVASLIALERVGGGMAGGLIGAATAAKLYAAPLVVPLVLLARPGRRGRTDASPAANAVGVFAAFVLPFVLLAPRGLASSFSGQLERGLQIESVGASFVALASIVGAGHPHAVFTSGAWNLAGGGSAAVAYTVPALGLLAVGLVWLSIMRLPEHESAVAVAFAATVAVVIVFTKVLSPQFLVWLVPLAALVRGRTGMAVAALLAAAMLLTQMIYPTRYEELVALQRGAVVLLVGRNVLLVSAAIILVRALRQRHGGSTADSTTQTA
jgi:uncharacterized membrane protein